MGKRRYHNPERSPTLKGITSSITTKPPEGGVFSCKGTST
jgi:hypothetical protein